MRKNKIIQSFKRCFKNSQLITQNSKLRNAQVSLELSVAFICLLLLLMASVRLFMWFSERMIHRQKEYENTRAVAAQPYGEKLGEQVNETGWPALDLFGRGK